MVDDKETLSINIRLKGKPKEVFEQVMDKYMFESYADGFRFILSQYVELLEKSSTYDELEKKRAEKIDQMIDQQKEVIELIKKVKN